MNTYPFYLAGKFTDSDNKLIISNSYTSQAIAEVALASEAHLNQAIEAAQNVQHELAMMPSYMRYEILMHIAALLTDEKEPLAKILSLEACKPLKLALGEMDRAIQTFIVAAE